MQQFTVPQFIDVEDKIIGPITTRQFLILLVGAMFIGLCYRFLDFTGFVVTGLIIFAVSGVFAFLPINGMPFHFFVLNFIQTLKRPPVRVWNQDSNRDLIEIEDNKIVADEIIRAPQKTLTKSRLNELSLIVDTQGAYKGDFRSDNVREQENNF